MGLSSTLLWTLLSSAPLVDVKTVVPDLVLDLRYATQDNFLKEAVYPPGARCLLTDEAAHRLQKVADALRPRGFRLRVFDCYRPRSVQWKMWKLVPKPGYVANPRFGSHHNRGAAVDLTLATPDGEAVEMPTDFDTFTRAAHHKDTSASPRARANRETLLGAMESAGFRRNRMEWWHYELPNARVLPLRDEPLVPPKP